MKQFSDIQTREVGLKKTLTAGQLGMIALGGAIGTGLFLGSKFAIGFAGPSVILSYLIGGAIALMLMGVLAEMTVKHPTSGSFGAYAEYYLGPIWGFLTRYMYWLCIVLAVGTEGFRQGRKERHSAQCARTVNRRYRGRTVDGAHAGVLGNDSIRHRCASRHRDRVLRDTPPQGSGYGSRPVGRRRDRQTRLKSQPRLAVMGRSTVVGSGMRVASASNTGLTANSR